MARRLQQFLTGCLLLALVACGETPNALGPLASPSPAATRTPGATPVVAGAFTPPPGKIFFGAYVDPSGLDKGFSPGDVANFEAQIGRTLTLHPEYLSFTTNFDGNLLTNDYVSYRVPVVAWNCQFNNADIANGEEDPALIQAADQVRAFSGPIFIRYMWDPNLSALELSRSSCYSRADGDSDNQFSPTNFTAAWIHIHNIFVQEGATNAIWLWTISADPDAFPNPLEYYPGPQYVDWVGADAYDLNLNSGSVTSTYSSIYATLAPLSKPIMISETGAAGAVQPAFFASVASTLQSQFPLVKGWCYYDALNYNGQDNQDWRITPSALQSFTQLANSPYMSGTYVP